MSELPEKDGITCEQVDRFIWIGFFAVIAVLLIFFGIPELNRRRMAANQTAAAAACKAFAEAEEVYRRKDYDDDGVLEYAQSLQELARVGLIPKEFSDAEIGNGREVPYNGYVFRVLTSQGQYATGGPRNYINGEDMILGYGLAAYPAVYDVDSRYTFLISNNGTIFQEDRGEGETKLRLPAVFQWTPSCKAANKDFHARKTLAQRRSRHS